MNKQTAILISVGTLVLGMGAGYGIGTSKNATVSQSSTAGMHQMPDGTIMGESTSSSAMGDTMANMNAGLQGKVGDDFDRVFLAEMIVHHQGAVQMAQAAQMNAKHQEIKDLAAGIIAAQNKEISEMQAWEKSWYNQ